VVFFPQICDVAQVKIIHEYLAIFGYIKNMKVENLKSTLTYCRQLWWILAIVLDDFSPHKTGTL